jgi:hypothetical protein
VEAALSSEIESRSYYSEDASGDEEELDGSSYEDTEDDEGTSYSGSSAYTSSGGSYSASGGTTRSFDETTMNSGADAATAFSSSFDYEGGGANTALTESRTHGGFASGTATMTSYASRYDEDECEGGGEEVGEESYLASAGTGAEEAGSALGEDNHHPRGLPLGPPPPSLSENSTILSTDSFRQGLIHAASSTNPHHHQHQPLQLPPHQQQQLSSWNSPNNHGRGGTEAAAAAAAATISPVSSTALTRKMKITVVGHNAQDPAEASVMRPSQEKVKDATIPHFSGGSGGSALLLGPAPPSLARDDHPTSIYEGGDSPSQSVPEPQHSGGTENDAAASQDTVLGATTTETLPHSTGGGDGSALSVPSSSFETAKQHHHQHEQKPSRSASSSMRLHVSTTCESAEDTFEDSLKEIEMTLKLAKQEFEMGSPSNRRYHSPTKRTVQGDDGCRGSSGHDGRRSGNDSNDDGFGDDDDMDAPGDASSYTPSFLNRDHVFFSSASAAIAALLTPRSAAAAAASVSVTASDTADSGKPQPPTASPSRSVTSHASYAALDASAMAGSRAAYPDVVPKSKSSSSSVAVSSSSFQVPEGSSAAKGQQDPSQSAVSLKLLTEQTEKKIEQLQKRMHDPNRTLTELLTAIATPETADGTKDAAVMDMGFMVRRKNACGALKVMTNDPKKRGRICFTVGVLPALASVLSDGSDPNLVAFVLSRDGRIRDEYDAARNRAIAALLNLSVPKANRIAVFHTPGLVQSLLTITTVDIGEARKGCTAILAYLSRTAENRLLMVQVPGFSQGVVSVLQPIEPQATSAPSAEAADDGSSRKKKKKKQYPWMGESDSESEMHSRKSYGTPEPPRDEDSDRTPRMVPSKSPTAESNAPSGRKKSEDKATVQGSSDPLVNEVLEASRHNIFAVLSHVGKEKDNAYCMARDPALLQKLITVAAAVPPSGEDSVDGHGGGVAVGRSGSSSSSNRDPPERDAAIASCTDVTAECHALAVQFLANLTRHRLNTKLLVFQERRVVPVLVRAANSPSDAARLYACFAIQNMTQDKACRQELAAAPGLVSTLCGRGRYASDPKERLAAISTLKNLTDEPANLIPLTNTPACVATLMHLAHGKEMGVTELMQYRACDALASLSHWLRKIASSGQLLCHQHQQQTQKNQSPQDHSKHQQPPAPPNTTSRKDPPPLFVPSLRVVTWNQWE